MYEVNFEGYITVHADNREDVYTALRALLPEVEIEKIIHVEEI